MKPNFLSFGQVLLIFTLPYFSASSQVKVHQEPRHRPVFENREIRILNVEFPPGDTTLYHVHSTPSVFIHFTSTAVGSQLKGAIEVNAESVAGDIVVEDLSGDNIRTHRVWNRDKSDFHVMDVELLYKKYRFTENPLNRPEVILDSDTTWVRTYRLNLETEKEFTLKNQEQAFLLISLDSGFIQSIENGKTKNQDLKPGDFLYLDRKKSFSLINSGDQTLSMVLLEFPIQ